MIRASLTESSNLGIRFCGGKWGIHEKLLGLKFLHGRIIDRISGQGLGGVLIHARPKVLLIHRHLLAEHVPLVDDISLLSVDVPLNFLLDHVVADIAPAGGATTKTAKSDHQTVCDAAPHALILDKPVRIDAELRLLNGQCLELGPTDFALGHDFGQSLLVLSTPESKNISRVALLTAQCLVGLNRRSLPLP